MPGLNAFAASVAAHIVLLAADASMWPHLLPWLHKEAHCLGGADNSAQPSSSPTLIALCIYVKQHACLSGKI
jgi:hypothetical protein